MAKTIDPAHTFMDGDTLFVMATGTVEVDPTIVGMLATKVVTEAIVNAVKMAKSVANFPAYQDLM